MQIFSNIRIVVATFDDIPAIRNLLNSAYRGESSKRGWTTEAHLIGGNVRTNDANIEEVMRKPGSIFLKYLGERNEIVGCVNLQHHDDRIYLGMFSVSPGQQGSGIGKQLLLASEEYAKHLKCKSIYMSVISVRTELIKWYERHGYRDTNERIPFVEDKISGRHLQQLEFMIMEKFL
jgi:ribosomal protein S18 acetylase RimI-like enzyme